MTIPDQILAQARRTPDAVAVRQWDTLLTYRELTGQAAAVAEALRDMGVRRGDRVGVCSTRGTSHVVTVLGIVAAGAAYVPMDPGGPRQRLLEIAEDAGVTVVAGDAAATEFGATPGIRTLTPEGTATPRPCPATDDDTFHVLYTSGSTGRPKGVLTTHGNVAAFVAAWQRLYPVAPGTRTLAASSLGFDAATIDLYVPLTAGAQIQLVPAADRADPDRLRRFLVAHDVEWGLLTPTMLSTLDPADVPGWRTVMAGGEPLPAELAATWAPGRRFANVYGPTETTVSVVTTEVTAGQSDPLPIGRITPGHHGHVVDDHGRPVPDGEPGELLVGGPGIAAGYLNRPGLTAARFVPDPFCDRPGARLYRTGDRVRRDRDGVLTYLGRIDRQVKVRGQRIELGEVEAVLAAHPGVRQAAVEAVAAADGTRLVAFLTPATAPGDAELAAHTSDRLTAAMRPAVVLRRDELPADPRTGKLDRGTLRTLAEQAVADLAAAAPGFDGSPAEQEIARVWARVLGRTPARDTDFFACGGNSIAAMRLVAALRDQLGSQVSVEDLFSAPTVPALAAKLATAAPLPGRELTTGNPPTLSPPQVRLWFTDQLVPDDAPYNIALAQRLHGPLDIAALRAALRAVADRHDVLRWRIKQTAGAPYAERTPPADVPLHIVDTTAADLEHRLAAGARHVFDLAGGPAWHVTLYRLGAHEHVLAITVHHAVFDGWSQAPLYADLAAAYAQALGGATPALPPLPAGYADYAVWRDRRDRAQGAADLAWWTGHLAGAPTVLDLPRDRPRPAVATYTGAETSVAVPSHVDAAVRALAARLGTTTAAVLLAGLAELLRRLTGTPDHILGAIVADRTHAEFDDAVGFFVDTVPVRLRAGTGTFADAVLANATGLRDATAHPAAPLDKIVDALGVPRDTSRAPLVQMLFNVLNFDEPGLRLSGVDSAPIAVPKPGSPFDLTVYVTERDGRFAYDTVHNPDLFDTARIDALLTDLAELTGALAGAPDADPAAVAPHLPRAEVRTAAPGAMTVTAPEIVTMTLPVPGDGADAMEELLAGIWREVLGRDTVGVAENFFDIGGHSMAMAAVHGKLTAATGRQIRMLDLFRYPNIRALAAHLAGPADKPLLAGAAARAAARRNRARRNPPRRTTGGAQ